jgi:CRP-like cAMP-binding protein
MKKGDDMGYPETLFQVKESLNCPLYEKGDRIKVKQTAFVVGKSKPSCIILVDDIKTYLEKKNDKNTEFNCSGCSGLIRVFLKSRQKEIAEKQEQPAIGNEETIRKLLKDFPFFQALGEENIKELTSFLNYRKFDRGQTIIRRGEAGKNLYLIIKGKVEVLVGEKEVSVAYLEKGEIFGEMSLLTGDPVMATIKTVEPTAVVYIKGAVVGKFLNKFPSLPIFFVRLLIRRLARTNIVKSEDFLTGITGKLEEIPPSELIQTLNIHEKTGTLTIQTTKGEAVLLFHNGNVVGADFLRLKGRQAFFEVLRENRGTFKFQSGLAEEYKSLPEIGDLMWMLMEGIRRIDNDKSFLSTRI